MKFKSKNKREITLTNRAYIAKVKFKLTEKIDQKLISRLRAKKLKNKDFTIISNNCFAGWVYRRYNLSYLTPTVGLFIMPKDYIKFLNNLKYYIECELKFINPNKSKYKDYISSIDERFGKYPIGILEDIEIHFLHYKDENEAKEKWNRRKQRINWDNIIVKFSEQNNCEKDDIKNFFMTPYKNKICFVAKSKSKINEAIQVKEFEQNGYTIDDTWLATKYINFTKFLNDCKR